MYQLSGFRILPPVTKNIIILNVIFFLGINYLHLLPENQLALYFPSSEYFRPYQIATHMFMHANFGHIFFNMFALWMFGSVLENHWGPQKFLLYYFVCGLGAAALHYAIISFQLTPEAHDAYFRAISGGHVSSEGLQLAQDYSIINNPILGASGAVFGLLLAFGVMFPNTLLYVYFFVPIKAKYFVIIYGAIELWSGFANSAGDNVAHFAHIGGMITGLVLLGIWWARGKLY